MFDRGDDIYDDGERLGGVVKVEFGAAVAVRDHDEQQPVAADRAIFGHRQDVRAERYLARRVGAGMPHRPFEGWAVGVGRDLDQAETGSLRHRSRKVEGHRDEEFDGVQEHGSLGMRLVGVRRLEILLPKRVSRAR